jgi:hypothetical protein
VITHIPANAAPAFKAAYSVVRLDDLLPLPGEIIWADTATGRGAMHWGRSDADFDLGPRAIAIVKKR